MASTTPNLNLYKPDRTEYVSVITDLNNNLDIIDQKYGETDSSISNINNSISNINDLLTPTDVSSYFTYSASWGTIESHKEIKTGNIVAIYLVFSPNRVIDAGLEITMQVAISDSKLRPHSALVAQGGTAGPWPMLGVAIGPTSTGAAIGGHVADGSVPSGTVIQYEFMYICNG